MTGNDLKKIMEEERLSQVELASLLDVAQSTISTAVTKGHRDVSFSLKQKVKNYLANKNINIYDIDNSKFGSDESVNDRNGTYTNKKVSLYSRPYYATDQLTDEKQIHKPEHYISIPELSNVEMFVRIFEDTCSPSFKKGDIIGIKSISPENFFATYRYYIIITKTNKQRLLGLILQDDNKDDIIVRFDSEIPDLSLPKTDIGRMYEILGRIEI